MNIRLKQDQKVKKANSKKKAYKGTLYFIDLENIEFTINDQKIQLDQKILVRKYYKKLREKFFKLIAKSESKRFKTDKLKYGISGKWKIKEEK